MASKLEILVRYNLRHPAFDEKKGLICLIKGRYFIGTLEEDLPSTLIGGLPRRGKTMAACMWVCTIAIAGGELVVVDPHCKAPRNSMAKALAPLAQWFACTPIDFSDTESIVLQFQWIYREFLARVNGETAGKKLLYVIIDEWSGLLERFDPEDEDDKRGLETVLRTVKAVAKEGRKLGMYLTLISHQWNLKETGGSGIRKSVTGRVAFDSELADMRLVLAARDMKKLEALTTPQLHPGEAIMKTETGMQRVSFLKTGRAECELVAGVIRRVQSEYSAHSDGKTNNLLVSAGAEERQREIEEIKPEERKKAFGFASPDTPNGAPNVPNVRLDSAERSAIIAEGNKLLLATGHVIRTKIHAAMKAQVPGWDSDDYWKIQSVCDELGWHRAMNYMTDAQWEELKRAHNYTCVDCGRQEPEIALERDHVIPRVKGGSDVVENRAPRCKHCNQVKGIKKEGSYASTHQR